MSGIKDCITELQVSRVPFVGLSMDKFSPLAFDDGWRIGCQRHL